MVWSHRSRFELGLKLAAELAGGRLLDYGSGDGTFLGLLMARPTTPAAAVGAEVDEYQVNDCRTRLGSDPRLTFVRTDDLTPESHAHAFDGLVCMEVLEHVPDWQPVFDRWRWLVKPGGRILVSVPVETGPALALKQLVRRLAAWRGHPDYPGSAPYTWSEYFRSLVAGVRQHVPRPIHTQPGRPPYHCHKGFNWRVLRAALARRFHVERAISSPVTWLPPGLGSQ